MAAAAGSGGLLERDAELARLAALLGEAAAGAGAVAAIEGPAGIGKTALIEAVHGLAADRGVRSLLARGRVLEAGMAFAVVRQLVERVVLLVAAAETAMRRAEPGDAAEQMIERALGLLEGATVVVLPRFDLGSFLRAVADHRVTRAELVPPMVLGLASSDLIAGHDLSSLRVLTSGAAPLGADLARACARRLGCRVKQMYGLTETGGASHSAPDDGPDHADSIGPALPGVECRVIDPDSGAGPPPDGPGELLIRTPGNMRGYLGNPEATAATIDAGGWLHTGDIVTVDAGGWYRVAVLVTRGAGAAATVSARP